MTTLDPSLTVYQTVCAYKDALSVHLTVNPPTVSWCQLGAQIHTCESWAVGCTGVREEALFPSPSMECQMLEVLDLVGSVARECSFEADGDGITDPAQVEAISTLQDSDVTALRAWGAAMTGPAFTVATVNFINEGGLAITTLSVSAYAGW